MMAISAARMLAARSDDEHPPRGGGAARGGGVPACIDRPAPPPDIKNTLLAALLCELHSAGSCKNFINSFLFHAKLATLLLRICLL